MLFLDCKIGTLVVELTLVQVPELGQNWDFPPAHFPPLPLSGGLGPGPLFARIAPHAQQGQGAGVSRMVMSHFPARLDRASQVGG